MHVFPGLTGMISSCLSHLRVSGAYSRIFILFSIVEYILKYVLSSIMIVWHYFYSSDSSWRTQLSLNSRVPNWKDVSWVSCPSVQRTCKHRLCITFKWLVAVGIALLLRSLNSVLLCPKCFTSYFTVFDSVMHNPGMEQCLSFLRCVSSTCGTWE